MRIDDLISIHALRILVLGTATMLCLQAAAVADDKLAEVPEPFRGTWLLRLTSNDGGKSYKSGDGKAICEVSPTEIKFTRKVEFSDEKLIVKSVTKSDDKGKATYVIGFENKVVWRLFDLGGSITAIIHAPENDTLTETYRITVRRQSR